MTRPDAKLFELATAVELSAFDKYDVIEHNISRDELTARGIDGKTIPMQLLFEVKRNEDGSYLKHKCRCILLGHQGFLTAGLDFEETYAPAPTTRSLTSKRLTLRLQVWADCIGGYV